MKQIGDQCPAFELPDQNGNIISSKDLIGKKILVIYFYPNHDLKSAYEFKNIPLNYLNLNSLENIFIESSLIIFKENDNSIEFSSDMILKINKFYIFFYLNFNFFFYRICDMASY